MKVKDIVVGETYNGLKILKDLGRSGEAHHFLSVCPVCGCEMKIRAQSVGHTRTCIHCVNQDKRIDITGKRFGRLVAVEYVGQGKGSLWRCVCDCGNECIKPIKLLNRGAVKSCGCLQKDFNHERGKAIAELKCRSVSRKFREKHQQITTHPLYRIWYGIISRCNNPDIPAYPNYGGRGIKVCDRWSGDLGFENFVNDMGERPSKNHSIDRIDVNGNYEPSNCRWATQKEQCNNTRRSVFLTHDGRTQTLKQWCEELGCNYGVVGSRRHHGYTDFNDLMYGKARYVKNRNT